jgi:hypothetical protein
MTKVRFLNHEIEAERAVFYCLDGGLEQPDKTVKLKFKDEIPSNEILCTGFDIINEYTDDNMSDDYYHCYTTIYRRFDKENVIQLSRDGSVYIEQEDIEPKPCLPTLEELKATKIYVFSKTCNTSITNGVDVEFDKDYVEHFSYTEEDQVNLKEIFDLAIQTNVPMYYHSDGEGCKLYTVEQIIAIYTTATTNKMHHTTYFNQLRMYIESLGTIEEVEAVEYGQELTDEYLQTYNESMAQAQIVLEALLAKRAALLNEV